MCVYTLKKGFLRIVHTILLEETEVCYVIVRCNSDVVTSLVDYISFTFSDT